MSEKMQFKVGDRVTRRKVNAFRYNLGYIGTVVEIKKDGRCFIKWDEKSGKYGIPGIGQQHSTINPKFLTPPLMSNITPESTPPYSPGSEVLAER